MSTRPIDTYRALDADKLIATADTLAQRIGERFPEAGLYRVAQQLLDTARMSAGHSADLARPIAWVRVVNVLPVLLVVALLVIALLRVELRTDGFGFFDFVQVLEAGINDVILIGAALFFLVTLERRIKRGRALADLHQLRSLAHVVDMHQLTKDPDRVLSQRSATASSPRPTLSAYELGRYLDYCSEMLAIIGKLAALYVQNLDDNAVLASVDEIESLTNGLSRKIWQKVMILYQTWPVEMGGVGDDKMTR
ncbi:MAG: hypothetical protein M9936_13360 [Caldilinea sp.]|nr:hypothetical protein [Caldilinea sp.]